MDQRGPTDLVTGSAVSISLLRGERSSGMDDRGLPDSVTVSTCSGSFSEQEYSLTGKKLV